MKISSSISKSKCASTRRILFSSLTSKYNFAFFKIFIFLKNIFLLINWLRKCSIIYYLIFQLLNLKKGYEVVYNYDLTILENLLKTIKSTS